MPDSNYLPRKEDFFKDIETLEACDICYDTFNDQHVPMRTKCRHIFGSTCLREWTDQSNTCPKCRVALFVLPVPAIEFKTGSYVLDDQGFFASWVHNMHDHAQARSLTEDMWDNCHRMLRTFGRQNMYSGHVELAATQALSSTALKYPQAFPRGLHISLDRWPQVQQIGEDMFQWHNLHFQSARLADADYNDLWLPKMMGAFGWELDVTEKSGGGEGTEVGVKVGADAGARVVPGAFPEA